ncbi:MAG TPA: ABC transporter permease [Chthoniobacteraceae bacterium]|nr:ABC transporter permease [Chthoniobacteraceae bacterium]
MMQLAIRNIVAITKRELTGFFTSAIAYVFIFIWLLLVGFFTFSISHWFTYGQASLGNFFMWHSWVYLILVPAIGMGIWSEERRLGTIELLLTMPVTAWQAIVGKFLAAWAVLGIALALTFPMIITVNYLGHPDNGVIVAGYIGSFLMAGSFLGITSIISALTRSPLIAFIVSVVICLFLVLAGFPPVTDMLVNWANPVVVNTIASFSVVTHFMGLQKGVLDSRDIIYFFSVIGFSLFTTSVIIRTHRAG